MHGSISLVMLFLFKKKKQKKKKKRSPTLFPPVISPSPFLALLEDSREEAVACIVWLLAFIAAY